MGLFGFGKKKASKTQRFAERDNSAEWMMWLNQYGVFDEVECYKPEDAYRLAMSLPEIFLPIDMIADACASLEYRIVEKDTFLETEFRNANIQRLFKQPNPFSKFADLVYQGVFAKFADGNCYDYTKIPDSFKKPTVDNIQNVWTLDPSKTKPVIKDEIPNPFGIKDTKELIKEYKTYFFVKQSIDPLYIKQHTLLSINKNGKGETVLNSVEKNINNLLAVYSARYNVYDKNMNGGILSKDKSQNTELGEVVDPANRDKILKDLQDRNGLTGNRNFIGISSVPLKFVKTLATIQELQPFDETEADAVAIASVFGLDSDLVPKRIPSKFSNKIDGERKLWQTVIKATAIERGEELARAFYLPDNLTFYPDFSQVEILQEDKKTSFEADKILLENLGVLSEQGVSVDDNYQKIKDKYDTL